MDQVLDFSFILPLVSKRYCEGYGRPAEHPERMWRLLFAQYYLNLSDDRVCQAAHDTLSLRLFLRLGIDETPPHPTTLQKFRFNRLQEGDYLDIHHALLKQAEEKGLLKRDERQIFDTTHMHSDTRVVSLPRLLLHARAQVVKEVKRIDPAFGQELEARAEEDRAAYRRAREERQTQGLPKPGKEEKAAAAAAVVAKTLAEVETRIAAKEIDPTERLNVALAILAKVIADRDDGATERIVSVRDPEARKGRKGPKTWDGRKVALSVMEDSRLIVSVNIASGNRNDCQLLEPLLDQQEEGLGITPPELSADKGADYGPLRLGLKERGILAHVPITTATNSEGADLFKTEDFAYDEERQTLSCPGGHTSHSVNRQKYQSRDGFVFYFKEAWCQGCPLRGRCQRSSGGRVRGRQVFVSLHRGTYEEARQHNQTEHFRRAYAKRASIESKVWELVWHGARRCRYLGDTRSQVQALVTAVVVNAKRLLRLLSSALFPGSLPQSALSPA
jgi:hypothetical protein